MTAERGSRSPWVEGETVGSVLRATALRYPDHDALVFPLLGLRWSWKELDRRVDLAASSLLGLGVGRGSHVGIWSMNAPEWVVTQFAVGRIGAVLVNINPAYRLHELEETLRAADVETFVVGAPFKGSNFVAMVESVCPEVAAPSADWSTARLPTLRRLIAAGRPPRAGLAPLGRPGRRRPDDVGSRNARRGPGRATSTTSSSPRARRGSPRARCSRTETC